MHYLLKCCWTCSLEAPRLAGVCDWFSPVLLNRGPGDRLVADIMTRG